MKVRALAALGLAAVAASAVPLIRVWTAPRESPSAPLSAGDGKFLVDLVDGATDADVRAIEAKYNVTLTPNSSVTVKSNRLYHVVAKSGSLLDLDALKADSRVEAAEPEIQVSLSPDELGASRQREIDLVQKIQVFTSEGPLKGRHIIYFSGRSGTQSKLTGPNGEAAIPLGNNGESDNAFGYAPSQRIAGEPIVFLKSASPVVTSEARANPVQTLDESDPNGTRPNDPRYDEQWNFKMIGAEEAWKRTRGKGVVVAVIDTGVAGPDYKKRRGL